MFFISQGYFITAKKEKQQPQSLTHGNQFLPFFLAKGAEVQRAPSG